MISSEYMYLCIWLLTYYSFFICPLQYNILVEYNIIALSFYKKFWILMSIFNTLKVEEFQILDTWIFILALFVITLICN